MSAVSLFFFFLRYSSRSHSVTLHVELITFWELRRAYTFGLVTRAVNGHSYVKQQGEKVSSFLTFLSQNSRFFLLSRSSVFPGSLYLVARESCVVYDDIESPALPTDLRFTRISTVLAAPLASSGGCLLFPALSHRLIRYTRVNEENCNCGFCRLWLKSSGYELAGKIRQR